MSDLAAEAPAPVQAPTAEPAAVAPATPPAAVEPSAEAPKTMLDAIERSFNRDEAGRFARKDGEPQQAAPVAPGEAAKPAEPEDPADIAKMPDGLGQKAQQRFQALANGLKETRTELEGARQQVEYVQSTFQSHGVTQPQFEQAMAVVGMLNKGDFRSALRVLDEQRRQIAIALGEPLPGVDVLSDFQDLRQRVDGLQMTEADAIEVARLRRQQAQYQQQQANQAHAMQTHQAQQREVQAGQAAVDQWARATAATDPDFAAIEKLLMPKLAQIVDGVPPAKWAGLLKAQYELIKDGAAFRRPASTAATPDPLRPTGGAGAQRAPSSMYEAMWNRSAA